MQLFAKTTSRDIADVAGYQFDCRVVGGVCGGGIAIIFDGGKNGETRILDALGRSPGAGKEIDCCEWCHQKRIRKWPSQVERRDG